MNRLTPKTALGMCLGALLVAALAGCSNSTPTGSQSGYGNRSGSGNPSGSGMRGAQGPGGPATSTPGGGTGGGGTGGGGTGGNGQGGSTGMGEGIGTGMPGPTGSGKYSSVGERIWLTGVGSDGNAVVRSAPRVSQGALMMGGGGCGSCHAASGRGGTIRMMIGTEIKAPDVTYGALIKEGFTDATIRQAIIKGIDESGKPLKEAMPRWQMSSADMDATIAYLKVLDGS